MNKILLVIFAVILVLLVLPIFAYAETTGGPGFDNDLGGFNGFRSYVVGHDHEYTDANTQRSKNFEIGPGLDLILQERAEKQNNLTPLKTVMEARYDFGNKNGGVYVVATYRLSEVVKGVKDLFTRE